MNWHCKTFDELTNQELYALLKARVDVFVVEQQCAYEEIDDLDQQAVHYFAEEAGEMAALVRVLPKNTTYESVAIGRVLVTKKFRQHGLGRTLMERAIAFVLEEWKEETIQIQAQTYLQSFYESLGFVTNSDEYDEDDIPHIDMLWQQN